MVDMLVAREWTVDQYWSQCKGIWMPTHLTLCLLYL